MTDPTIINFVIEFGFEILQLNDVLSHLNHSATAFL